MQPLDQQRIRELFQQAIKLPADQRERFLESSPDDPSVLRAVRHLLNYHRTATILSPAYRVSMTTDDVRQSQSPTEAEEAPRPAIELEPRQTSRFFQSERRRMWSVVVVGLALFCLVAAILELSIKSYVRQQLSDTMQAALEEQAFAMELWLKAEFRVLQSWAKSNELVAAISDLESQVTDQEPTAHELATLGEPLRTVLHELSKQPAELSYAVWNRKFELIADANPNSPVLGNGTTDYGSQILGRVFRGETVLWTPSTEGFMTAGFTAADSLQTPGIAIIVPIIDDHDETIAAMLVAPSGLQARFEELLQKARYGNSGEAYAVDRNGFLITESRFAEQLVRLGLLPEPQENQPTPMVRVAEPSSGLTPNSIDLSTREEWPLTKAARLVTRGESSSDFKGYPDYRGVEVVGTWTWLDEFKFGIILENDMADAYQPMVPLRIMNGAVLLLALLGFAASMLKWRSDLNHFRRLGVESRIGSYLIQERIGEGGMAQVFLATHALLKRPTALKLLKPDQINARNQARFEREVQLASRLTHPNTIEIYDYGVTQRNEFYCAMEFIPGFNLQTLVELDGAQAPSRVVHILKGICRSLREAHGLGLVHRDIKPQNVMLCERGGEADFVKVLDFGLARDSTSTEPSATSSQILVGTPMFIPPERIHDPKCLDPRSDIFALGIVGFILLTASQPHASSSSVDSLIQALESEPERPSRFVTSPIPAELDQLIYECQHRNPADRPQTIDLVLQRLEAMPIEAWQQTSARRWWNDFGRLVPEPSS